MRYFVADDLVEALYRGLADNTVGKLIHTVLRISSMSSGSLPSMRPAHSYSSASLEAAYEHRSLGLASHWPFEQWGHFLPVQTTAASLLDRLLQHAIVVVTSGESLQMKEARARSDRRTIGQTTTRIPDVDRR